MSRTRRQFLRTSVSAAYSVMAASMLGACGESIGQEDGPTTAPQQSSTVWTMPDEAAPHVGTWMAFAASDAIWGNRLKGPVQDALARIANAIVQFEPVHMLVGERDLAAARQKCDPRVNLIVQAVDDLWMRDSGPVFVKSPRGELGAVNFNFSGWGGKQVHALDSQVAAGVASRARARLIGTKLVLEGGAIEVDGNGTAILAESCVLNRNRNPGLTKPDCEAALKNLLGLRKIIWLPGIAGRDITDGHVDFYARFARPGTVFAASDTDPTSYDHAVTRQHLQILRQATDADNKPLTVIELPAPEKVRPAFDNRDFAAGYVNFYVCNGGVVIPEFGDGQADVVAKQRIAAAFPGRTVVQVNIDPIAAGGGGIHCTTQQWPA